MSDERDNKDIALIMQDITYIKGDMAEIKASLKILLEGYMPRVEIESKFAQIQHEMDTRFAGSYIQIEKKASQTAVDNININLSKVVWIILIAVLGALLSLILI